MFATLLKHKANVGLVEETLVPEISLADSCPDLLALPRTSNHWPAFTDKLRSFVLWNIGKTGEGLRDTARLTQTVLHVLSMCASGDIAIRSLNR